MDLLAKRLKEAIVKNLLNSKQETLDCHYMTSSAGSFSKRELAFEIENETEVGLRVMENLILLALDLTERKK